MDSTFSETDRSEAAERVAAGDLGFGRLTRTGGARGLYCGMGVCWECCVEGDDGRVRRACITRVVPGPDAPPPPGELEQ